MDPVKGIILKIMAAAAAACMTVLIREIGPGVPVGEIVFFRCAVAAVMVLTFYSLRGQFAATIHMRRPRGHLARGFFASIGMSTSFASFLLLPLADATALGFAAPLLTVALAAIILKEEVKVYRWSAVGVGFCGILLMVVPHLGSHSEAANSAATLGVVLALISVCCQAANQIQARLLAQTETTSSIVFYLSVLTGLASAMTLPFAWHWPTMLELVLLVMLGVVGGVAHIWQTESFRLAPASLVAPFDYTVMIWAILFGYFLFDEVPTTTVYMGSAIIIVAGLFVIWRERQLGLERARAVAN